MLVYSLAAGCRKRSREKNRDWISSPDAQHWVVVVAIVAKTFGQENPTIPKSEVQAEL